MMFSTFLTHNRNRRQDESNPETPTTPNTGYSTQSATTIRRSRRVTPTSGNVIASGSTTDASSERSPKLGSRGRTQVPSTSILTSPTRRETHGSSEYPRRGRRNPPGVASTEWSYQDERKPRSNSRRRRLYPPQNEEAAISSSPNLYEYEPDFTTAFERPQSRAEHRPGDTSAIAIGPPPQVVRLDSTGSGDNDSGLELEIRNIGDDSILVRIFLADNRSTLTT